MKTLIIAEKPDMGRNIAAAIEPKAMNRRTYIEGERYIITWAIGHLLGLAEPDAYDDKYKKWNIDDLPIIPERFKLVPNPKTKDQLKVIAELAKRCDRLINACDAGREGQHIFSLIQRHLKLRQPVKRLWISDLTPETIRRGFSELKDAAEYENLTKAAKARSEADWLIGMNGSRAFTTKHQVLLSVGRVQTPVLALLYDRQKEIEAFTASKYYVVEAHFKQNETEYRGLWQGDKLTDSAKAEAIARKVRGKSGTVAGYDVKETKEYPFKLYDLTLLQREANARFAFSAKKTLDLAQSLYEKHKVISYPRTTSNYVTEQNIPEMHKALNMLRRTSYGAYVEEANQLLVHPRNKAVCNPAKVEDHHAILPTHRQAKGLTADESKIYDLIVRRFLSHYYPPAEYKVHTVLTKVEEEPFKTTVKQLLAPGWKVLYAGQGNEQRDGKKRGRAKEDEDDSQAEDEVTASFELDPSLAVRCSKSAAREKETKPPKAYTEGTLLKAMESAGKQIEDEELRDAMKDSGLGTPATRAAIIERLKQVGYVVMKGKQLAITQKGRTAVELIRGAGVDLLTSPEMTGQWERRLNQIARGAASDEAFMDNVKRFAAMIVDKVKGQARVSRQAFEDDEAAKPARSRRARSKAEAAAAAAKGAQAARGKRTRLQAAPASAAARGGRAASAAAGEAAAAESVAYAPAASAPVAAPASSAAAGRRGLGPCPAPGCGGTIIIGRRGYGCSHYKTGCRFVVWKEQHGASLTPADIAGLLRSGTTAAMELSDPAGRRFRGRLRLADRISGQLEPEPASVSKAKER